MQNYLNAIRQADPAGNLLGANDVPDEYLFRTGETARSQYFDLKQVGTDLWVLSVTVPTIQEDSGKTSCSTRSGRRSRWPAELRRLSPDEPHRGRGGRSPRQTDRFGPA